MIQTDGYHGFQVSRVHDLSGDFMLLELKEFVSYNNIAKIALQTNVENCQMARFGSYTEEHKAENSFGSGVRDYNIFNAKMNTDRSPDENQLCIDSVDDQPCVVSIF